MIRRLVLIFSLGFIFSCSDSKDCECTVTNESGEKSKLEFYDHDGSCSDMNDDNVVCKEI